MPCIACQRADARPSDNRQNDLVLCEEAAHIAVKFFNEDGEIDFTPAALHVDGKLGVSRTIFGDAFQFLQQTVTKIRERCLR